jgi:hypothetical protein
VLDDAGELRLHLRLRQNANAADPSCVFKAKVDIRPDGWSRLELSVAGTRATLKLNGKTIASDVDVSGPKTAPGATKSYLPRTGFAALGGGPDYSTGLSFDNFTVGSSASPAAVGSICGAAAPAAGMQVVGFACGLDVPGLAFDIVGQRIMPRTDHSLCITAADNATALVLQDCAASNPNQDWAYDRAKATVKPPTAAPSKAPSPWQRFSPGEGIPYAKPYKAGDTIEAVRHLSKNHAAPFAPEEALEFLVNGVSQGKLVMPALLPGDAVGCIGTCMGATTATAVATAAFDTANAAHGQQVKVGANGGTASWSDRGVAAGSGCNEVALLKHTNRSFSVRLGKPGSQFVDLGWCSPSLDPAGSWPAGAASGWMGDQVGLGRLLSLFTRLTSIIIRCLYF